MNFTRVCIIPARAGSKRLKDKNIFLLYGKPLFVWSYLAAKKSGLFNKIYVSTENDIYIKLCEENGIDYIKRPLNLADDLTLKQEVIVNVKKSLDQRGEYYDQYMSLQANSPDITSEDLKKIVHRLEFYKRWEVVTVDKNLNQNGVARLMLNKVVEMKSLSAVLGVEIIDRSNIHTIEDIRNLERTWNPKNTDFYNQNDNNL